jgi:hypothetical protein
VKPHIKLGKTSHVSGMGVQCMHAPSLYAARVHWELDQASTVNAQSLACPSGYGKCYTLHKSLTCVMQFKYAPRHLIVAAEFSRSTLKSGW